MRTAFKVEREGAWECVCAVNGAIVVDEGSDSPHQFVVLDHVAFFPVFELNVILSNFFKLVIEEPI